MRVIDVLRLVEEGRVSQAVNALNDVGGATVDHTVASLLSKAQSELHQALRYRHGCPWRFDCIEKARTLILQALNHSKRSNAHNA